MILSGSAAAAAIGLINSIAQLGGFAGPYPTYHPLLFFGSGDRVISHRPTSGHL
jgi:hypothetical protein